MQHIEENRHLVDDALDYELNNMGLINEGAATKTVTKKDA
jgi:hypothetical protein